MPRADLKQHWDCIVVGGGASGAVVASRLSTDKARRVLLIEAGRDYAPGGEPAAVRDLFHVSVWDQRNLWDDVVVQWHKDTTPRRYEQARIIGGGTAVNAMVALRGVPQDYDAWEAAGATGWGWAGVLPYFRRLERDLDFSGPLHGADGPIPVRRHRREDWPPLAKALAAAARGMREVDDMNGVPADGVCRVPMSNLPSGRVTTAMAYLDEKVRTRPNLKILAQTTVARVLMEGTRVSGVQAEGQVHMAGEVILCAGALKSPLLLMRSGIGPAGELQRKGIPVIADLPGVGANLHDHPAVAVAALVTRSGMQPRAMRAAINMALRCSFDQPQDVYIAAPNKVSWHALGERLAALLCCLYKPYSRGRLSLDAVKFNVLDDPRDLARMVEAVTLAHSLLTSPEVRDLVLEVFPAGFSEQVRRLNQVNRLNGLKSAALLALLDGPRGWRKALVHRVMSGGNDFERLLADRRALEAWIKRAASGLFHPVGTCSIGSVVDPSLRVHGVTGVRVADASVMPEIPRGNTNLPAIMVAEKASDLIAAGT